MWRILYIELSLFAPIFFFREINKNREKKKKNYSKIIDLTS